MQCSVLERTPCQGTEHPSEPSTFPSNILFKIIINDHVFFFFTFWSFHSVAAFEFVQHRKDVHPRVRRRTVGSNLPEQHAVRPHIRPDGEFVVPKCFGRSPFDREFCSRRCFVRTYCCKRIGKKKLASHNKPGK